MTMSESLQRPSRTCVASLPLVFPRTLCLVLAMVAGISTFPDRAHADDADDAYALARKLYQDERWQLASQRFDAFLKDHPKHDRASLARLYRGLALVNLSDYRTARSELKRFLKDYPTNRYVPDATYRVGECSYLLNDFSTAERDLGQFLKQSPDHKLAEWALPYLGDTQLRLGKNADARRSFEKALSQFPEGRMFEDAQYGLARSFEKLDEPDRAIKLYEQVTGNPKGRLQAQAQLRIGLTHYGQREFLKAATACDLLMSRFPSHSLMSLARINAGFSYYQAGQYEEAIKRFMVLKNDPQRAGTAAYWKARSELALARYDDAIQTIQSTAADQIQPELQEQMAYLEALALLRSGQHAAAAQRFIRVSERWPKSDNADDAVHYACEGFLLDGKLDEARKQAEVFQKLYPDSSLRARQGVLNARILLVGMDPADQKQAAELLTRLIRDSEDPQAVLLARIYRARQLQSVEEFEQALTIIQPAVQSKNGPVGAERNTARILAATSLLELRRYADCAAEMDRLLDENPAQDQSVLAYSLRAPARACLQNRTGADADLEKLRSLTQAPEILGPTLLNVAEAAYEQSQWEWANDLFSRLQGPRYSNDLRCRGYSGVGWCQYQQKFFSDAATTFGEVVSLDSQHPLAAEASQMKGRALQADDKIEPAVAAYLQSLDFYAPPASITEGRPRTDAQKLAYESAKLALGLLEKRGESDRAGRLYQDLNRRFPNATDADQLLERWAFLLLENEQYTESDTVFKKLIDQFPESSRADTARYQLAESLLIVANDTTAAAASFRSLGDDRTVGEAIREAARTQLIRLDVESAQWDRVEESVRSFLEDHPKSKYRNEAELHLANALLNRNQLEAAGKSLEELREKWSSAPTEDSELYSRATLLLAEVMLSKRSYDQLDTLVETFTETRPKDPAVVELGEVQGRSWIKRSEFARARTAFEQVVADKELAKREVAARSQFMIAESWFFEEQYDKALEAYYLVVVQFNEYARWTAAAQYQIGQCDEAAGQPQKAAKTYRELIERHPESEFASKAADRLKKLKSIR